MSDTSGGDLGCGEGCRPVGAARWVGPRPWADAHGYIVSPLRGWRRLAFTLRQREWGQTAMFGVNDAQRGSRILLPADDGTKRVRWGRFAEGIDHEREGFVRQFDRATLTVAR